MLWWSNTYNRPLRDPLLNEYSFEELAYEYYLKSEQQKFLKESQEATEAEIEDQKWEQAEEWADMMEEEDQSIADPSSEPSNEAWMEEQLRIEREALGEEFGQDLSIDFNGDHNG